MNVLTRIISAIGARLIMQAARHEPDFVVGADNPGGPYLRRWWLIPRNRFLNIYLHQFLRDDDDRALHDHPWPWLSILLDGGYREHTIAAGGIHHRQLREVGSIKFSGPWRAHRVELLPMPNPWWDGQRLPCWTLFITGPRMRRWGFHCAEQGWVDYERFTAPGRPGEVGPGCAANDNTPAGQRKGAA
jgi:hypothetical protein